MMKRRWFLSEAFLLLVGTLLLSAGCYESSTVTVSPDDGADDTGAPDTGAPDTGDEPADTGKDPADTGKDPADTGDDPKDTGTEPDDTGPADTGTEPDDTGPADTGTEPDDTGPADTGTEPDDTDPVGTDDTDPVGTDDTDPVGTDDTDPVGTDDTDPVDTDDTDPVGTDDTDPVGTDDTDPVDTDDTDPVDTDDTDPVDTDDTDPVDTDDTDPVGTDDTDPVGTDDTDPVDTDDTDPLAVDGTPCGDGAECESGFCVDGVCCESSCDGDCAVCNEVGYEGACVPQAPDVVCRAASDHACDAPEVCDGFQLDCPSEDAFNDGASCDVDDAPCVASGTCTAPDTCAPVFEEDGETCAAAGGECFEDSTCQEGVCVVNYAGSEKECGNYDENNPCDAQNYCDGAGACTENYAGSDTVCRDAVGGCDIAEYCTGDSLDCPDDDFNDGAFCDVDDAPCVTGGKCTAADTCSPVFEEDGETCAAAGGECFEDSTCQEGVCVVNYAGTEKECGNYDENNPCDAQNYCDGAGACTENYAGSDTVCRDAVGGCDIAEYCTGDSLACPDDDFNDGAFCDVDDAPCVTGGKCTAADTCAPVFEEDDTVCGAAADECFAESTCQEGICTPQFADPGDSCGNYDENNPCDAQDTCDGAGACVENFVAANTDCGDPLEGECDLSVCDGAGACQPGYPGEETTCGDAPSGDCDAQNTCDGAGKCADRYQPATEQCRVAAGECDEAAFCTSASAVCPDNALKASTVECRPVAHSECDVAEFCTGDSAFCPTDVFNSGDTCTIETSACVTGGICNTADACAPVFAIEDTFCGDAAEPCDTSKCDNAGQCIPASAADDTTCGTAADVCFADSTCQSGVCTVQYQPGTFVCATGDAEDITGEDLYRCYEEDTCGAELQMRVRNSYCDGAGACHKAAADDWAKLDTCNDTTEICYADATNGACVPCGASDIPDDTCDGDKAIQYYAAGEDGYTNGTCVANACANYNYAEEDCAATGLVCDAGTCVDAPVALDCALCGGFDYKGHCWFLGAAGQSCTDACNANNLVYDGATRDVAGVRRDQNHIFYNDGICQNLVHALSPSTGEMQIFEGADNNYAVGCTYLGTLLGFLVNLPILHLEMETTADATRDDHRRVCACQAGGEFTCNAANARLYTEPVAVSADTCHAYYHDSGALALHYRGVQSDSDAITLRIRYCDGRTLSETLKPSGGPSGDVWTTLPQPPENCRIYVHVQSMNGYAWPLYIRSI
jgi:tetrahydromethanopterin S-methyltransferase subunit B